MMGSDATGSGLIIGEPRQRSAASARPSGSVDARLSSLLTGLHLLQLVGVIGVLLVYRSHGPVVDAQFLSGLALIVAAILLHKELRARLAAGLVRERRPHDASNADVSDWAEREVDRLLSSNGDARFAQPLPPLALN